MLSLATAPEIAGTLARRIRVHRLARGWTQSELAERAGLATPTYVLFERTGRVSLVRFIRILAVLGLQSELEQLGGTPAVTTRSIDQLTAPARQRGRRRTS